MGLNKRKKKEVYDPNGDVIVVYETPEEKENMKNISIEKYNEIMGSIIKKGRPVSDTLVEMLEEASKYKLLQKAKKKKHI